LALEAAILSARAGALQVTVSMGVSACPECADDPPGLVPADETALDDAMRAGRNRVVTALLVAARG
jgi:GGDEF domain-containing protein